MFGVVLGLNAVKMINIPLFLTMRRCGMLSIIICQYAVHGKLPEKVTFISTMVVCTGALISGYETIEANLFGVCLVWMNNFVTSGGDIIMEVMNKGKQITPFEINLSFSMVGGICTLIYTTVITDEVWLI